MKVVAPHIAAGRPAVPVIGLLILLSGLFSCGGRVKEAEEEEVLLTINDSSLTVRDVVGRIPVGTDPADSARMFHRIVYSWMESMLLRDMAEENLMDMSRIDRLTESYRNRLIVAEYLGSMRRQNRRKAPAREVEGYYRSHASELKTERPLVKGIFVKIPADARRLDDVRGWVVSSSQRSIDFLEQYALEQAMRYEYFQDRWVDWQVLADEIPYRFSDPDAFLEQNRDFETSYGGYVYIFHISDLLPSRSAMPLDFARDRIGERLEETSTRQWERDLVKDLRRKAEQEGKLKRGSYDPDI